MSAYRAAKVYSVPPTTLRDRISGRVATDARVGHETIFTSEEEDKLYQHITYMADIGFGYNKTATLLHGQGLCRLIREVYQG